MINKIASKPISSVLKSPLPISYILATDIFCSWCFMRSGSQKCAEFILTHGGLCERCNSDAINEFPQGESEEYYGY